MLSERQWIHQQRPHSKRANKAIVPHKHATQFSSNKKRAAVAKPYTAVTHVGCCHAVDEAVRFLDRAHSDLVTFEVAAALHTVQSSDLREHQ